MVFLKPGVLLKLVEETKIEKHDEYKSPGRNSYKPTLLQIRSIVPIMEEGDLWPNKGFHIKVCDLSHAMYVSLPKDMDDLILGDNLKLGQFIYVKKMELSHPVPTLTGVTILTDCQPCMGFPEEIELSIPNEKDTTNEAKSDYTSDEKIENCVEKQCVVEKEVCEDLQRKSSSQSEKDFFSGRQNSGDESADLAEDNSIHSEKESDSDSPKYRSTSRRRSWGGVPKGASPKPVALKPRRTRSVGTDDTDDNITLVKLRAKKTIIKSIHSRNRDHTARTCESQNGRNNNQTIQVELSKVEDSWDNLPQNLLKFGKEVVKDRDTCLVVAVEALQEAALAEKLLKGLSTFSEINEEKKDYEHRPLIEKFLDLQNDLTDAQLILESLTHISPLKTSDTDHISTSSVKTLNLAIERKKNATSWINAATASDIPPFSDLTTPITTAETSKRSKKSNKGSRNNYTYIPKSKIKTQDKKSENIDKEKIPTTESCTSNMISLVDTLSVECTKWFISHIEKILDEYLKISYKKEVVEMMQQIKQVNEWLDMIVNNARILNNVTSNSNEEHVELIDGNVVDDSIVEDCERVKCKIYKVLLEHVCKNTQ